MGVPAQGCTGQWTRQTPRIRIADQTRFNQQVLVDTTPMPADIPRVTEIGATSAPLTSAAYFIGDRCKAFNDDFMKCKAESNGRGEFDCLKEGRKVTRCAASVYVHPFPFPYPRSWSFPR